VRGILTQLPSRPTKVALASHTPFDPQRLHPVAEHHQAARHQQMPLHTGGSHDLERGTHRRVGNHTGGILGVGLVRHHQRDQHGHQPLPR